MCTGFGLLLIRNVIHGLCLFGILIISNSGNSQNLDTELFLQLHQQCNSNLDPIFSPIIQSSVSLGMAPCCAAMAKGMLKHERSDKLKALYIAESMAINAVFTYGMKYSINRNRPYDQLGISSNFYREPSPAFPIGHTSNAFVSATSFVLAYPKWYIAVPTYTWATAVGYSRIHVGVHYPSEVLFGEALGIASGYVTSFLNKQIFRTYQPPREY